MNANMAAIMAPITCGMYHSSNANRRMEEMRDVATSVAMTSRTMVPVVLVSPSSANLTKLGVPPLSPWIEIFPSPSPLPKPLQLPSPLPLKYRSSLMVLL